MLTLEVNMADASIRELLVAVTEAVSTESAAKVASESVADAVRDNFVTLAGSRHRQGQRVNYYLQAADSVIREDGEDGSVIRIPHTGIALRYFGGTVVPSGRLSAVTGKPIRRLAIGLKGTPGEGHVPADFSDLFCLPSDDGKKAVLAREDGGGVQALFALVSESVQKADASVLPPDDVALDAAIEGLSDLYESAMEKIR